MSKSKEIPPDVDPVVGVQFPAIAGDEEKAVLITVVAEWYQVEIGGKVLFAGDEPVLRAAFNTLRNLAKWDPA